MPSTGRRTVIPLSLSPANPDAVTVAQALIEQGVQPGKRSAKILEWAAAYVSGRAAQPLADVESAINEEELDVLLDDF